MLALIQNLNWFEILAILALGVLLFGRKLPEVGRSLGRGIVEFKKGLKGIGDEIENESTKNVGRTTYGESLPPYRPPLTNTGEDARVSQPMQSPVQSSATSEPMSGPVSGPAGTPTN